MQKQQGKQLFWTAITTIYIGGVVLYFAGVRAKGEFSSEIIPIDEPSIVDWASIGGILYFT